jgi:hypothetical protein
MESQLRRLISIPLLHTQVDMGTLAPSLERMKLSQMGRQGLSRSARAADQYWEEIERFVEDFPVVAGKVRIYQDGLPVCGHEQEIVTRLANAGSRNHQLLVRLQARGAVLMGTESPELLLEEYRLATAALGPSTLRTARREERQKLARDGVLQSRDRFIAQRINTTLAHGETGILLLGMLHAPEPYLEPDIEVARPIDGPRTGADGAHRH